MRIYLKLWFFLHERKHAENEKKILYKEREWAEEMSFSIPGTPEYVSKVSFPAYGGTQLILQVMFFSASQHHQVIYYTSNLAHCGSG